MKIFQGSSGVIVAVVLAVLVVVAFAIQGAMISRLSGELDSYRSAAAPTQPRTDRDTALPGPVPGDPPAANPPGDPFGHHDDWSGNRVKPDQWDPFAEMQRMQEDVDRIFSNAFSQFRQSPRFGGLASEPSFSPRIDVTEEKDRYVLRVDLPGVDEGSINVDVDGKQVRISGKRESVVEDQGQGGRSVRHERHVGEFVRTVELPGPVDATKMEAKQEQGVFTIVLPKDPGTQLVL